MSLQLILGSSGSGKSHRLYEEVIRDSMVNPSEKYIVIVPEQFTMGTQEKLVKMHPNHGVLNVDIVSFPRLAYKVFEELGVTEKEVLDDTGKSLIIRKILEEKKDELVTFKKNIDKPGFVEEVKSAVSEMLQYGVTPDRLAEAAENLQNPLLKYKLQDMITVYDGFKTYISGRYIASEEILEVLCRVADRSRIIRDSIVTLDGFTGFTPIQYRLLRILMECCHKITVALTMDSAEKPNVLDGLSNLFYLSKNTIHKLYAIADETGTAILPEIIMEDREPVRLKGSQGLIFLEKNIFRYNGRVYSKADEAVQIFEGNMPKNEIAFAVGEIKRLIMEKGWHYNDFAIVSADIETYGEAVVNILAQNRIPSFLDYKRNIMGNSAVSFLRGALQVLEEDFSYESVFGFLKTGFTDITREQADILENYCLAMGIRGFKRYDTLWIRKSGEMERLELSMEDINLLRERLLGIFETFRKEIKACETVLDYCKALYNFMVQERLEEKLAKQAAFFAECGEMGRKGEYEQVYGKITALLDKFVTLLGSEKMKFKEFNDILDAGFREIKVGLIPQSADAVIIGDIERTRIENVKALFFMGVNDGIIPKQAGSGGIISETDKEILRENEIELSMTEREKVFIQKFYLYLSMTKPSERLYLSYARICADGKARKMSYLLISIRKLFPNIRIMDEISQQNTLRLVQIPKNDMTWRYVHEFLDEETANKLYGDNYLTSVSAIESYSACAFAHFITYGLRLHERELYDIKATDIGTLYHDTLECFSKKLVSLGKTFTDITEEERKRLVAESVMEVTTDYGNTVLYSTKRNEYMISRVIAMADRTVWAVGQQLSKGRFVPVEFERGFVLDNRVRGRIDRIDTYDDGENMYIKVVDYKTGDSDFDLLDTYYGLKIQLVTYMNAAMALEKKKYPDREIIPAAMFYYNIKNPIVDETEDIDAAILEKLRVKGILNDDLIVLNALDNAREGKSLVVPVTYQKDGSVRESPDILTVEKMKQLTEYVQDYINLSMEEILKGDIAVKPYMKNKKTGCDYCDYRSICGFDEKMPGCKYDSLRNLSEEEVFKRIAERKRGEQRGTGVDK